jgi:PAS domain S-box-containing protein
MPPVEPASTSPLARIDPIRVLLVEDNPGDVRLILEALRSLPAELFDFERVDRLGPALDRLRRDGIDVVLLDLGLPDCSGLETFHRVQHDAPDQPILVISGLDDEGVALEAVRAGAQDYLVKGRMEGALLTRAIRYAIARKRADAALAESEARYQSILQHVANAVVVSDPATGLAEYVNPAYERLFEQESAYVLRTPNAWLERIHPDDLAAVTDARRRGAQGQDVAPLVFRLKRADGTIRWLRGRATPVRDAAGQVIRLVGISEDITELKRAEQQFFEAQKMEAVGRLAGGVAHDFNNVLTAILGYVDVLGDSLSAGDARREEVDEIRLAAQRAAGLTRQLLAFSRHQVLAPRVMAPNEVVGQLDRMLGRLIGEDIHRETSLSPDCGNILADAVQLEQVIINLAVNARDAMPRGGSLRISTANVTLLDHGTIPPGDYVVIAVSDSGEGMSPETMNRVFEPFFTTKEKGKGTGLGLSTVYGIVKQFNGHIDLESVQGAGTTFRIYLPRVDVSPPPAPTVIERPQPEILTGSETILLAEDEAQLRRLYATLLSRLGYRVLETANAEEALAIGTEYLNAIDLVISDVVMPVMSGSDLASRLQALRPDLRVLLISGYTAEALTPHDLTQPGRSFLQKPFEPVDLARRVRTLLAD